MKQEKKYREYQAPKLTSRRWYGGAITSAFVYSNKGNFVIKGFSGDVDLELERLVKKGYKFIVNKTFFSKELYSNKSISRNIWVHYKEKVYIHEREYGRKKSRNYFEIIDYNYSDNKSVKFKRLPKRWVKEMEI